MNSKNKVAVVPKELVIPFVLITSLFALWGFANDITNPMVSAFKKDFRIKQHPGIMGPSGFLWGLFYYGLTGSLCSKKVLLQDWNLSWFGDFMLLELCCFFLQQL
jgi:FHS family L-fucose permease-like MFS transporter